MNLYTINTGTFKLDGGAMFGVVPKSIWNKLNPADSNNMCTWAMRCLLVQDGNRLILIDNGIGDKQDDKFMSYYFLGHETTLEKSLNYYGFGRGDITDVFLTHLHFDHCGGSIRWNKDRTSYETAFPNACFWSNREHWEWATKPNAREKASFLKENILPIQESGQLEFVDGLNELIPGFSWITVNGHTGSMMLPKINYNGKTLVYMADLIPSVAHIPVAYVMAYDTRPLITLEEKAAFLKDAAANDYTLIFEHDAVHECCSLIQTERGIRSSETYTLSSFTG
ncbi:MAG TPA: MBL fold metallo-hydrolase [Bacteroidia bacterium]|nr:MBL fold metallo-hydrolase [Bacteroidia bacterium]